MRRKRKAADVDVPSSLPAKHGEADGNSEEIVKKKRKKNAKVLCSLYFSPS